MTEPTQTPSAVRRILGVFSARQGSNFRRNIIYVMRANIIAQAIVLLSTPLLSRLYSAEDFGRFALFSAIVAIAVSVSTGRFDWSIPNAGTAASAASLLLIGMLFLVATSLAAVLATVLAFMADNAILAQSKLGLAVFLIPLAMLGLGLAEQFNCWFVRQVDLQTMSHIKIAQGVSQAGFAVLAGFGGLGAVGLIGALILSTWVGIVIFAANALGLLRRLTHTSRVRFATTFLRYRRDASLSTAVSLINALSFSVSTIMIVTFFSLQEAGWYALMLRLAVAPIGVISMAVGQSFWSIAAELARKGQWLDLRALYLKTIGRLAWLVVPIAIGCGAGPFVVGPLFGSDEWGPAGYVLLAMAPHLIGVAVFSPTTHLIVYRRQAYQFASDALAVALTAISVYVAARLGLGIIICTMLVSLSILTGYVVRFFLHLRANSELSNKARAVDLSSPSENVTRDESRT